ncbi:hypothetical protein Taro_022034 [Colocasia esculenta]|uniref:Uncharacterized protein n=1 Tax=Colocasia esculenta TaxID=4460 RepID=A0A843V2U4_COLES|nr:hypothetical protein [Colocasia esculenta]
MGIHDQRRLTEALCKGSLVRRKEYPTESSPQAKQVGSGRQVMTRLHKGRDGLVSRSRRQALSRSDSDRALCRDGPCERGLSSHRVHRVCA